MSLLENFRRLLSPPALPARDAARSDIPSETLRRFPFIQERIDRWIDEKRFCEDIRNNTELARSLETAPEDLNWFFKAVIREDPRSWRVRLRIEEAEALLSLHPDMPVNKVAEAVGFSDPSNFSRQFRRFTGSSPQQWRELHYRY